MLKTLLKKQILELKYSYFRDRKTGKLKSKKAIIGFSILYVFLFACLGFSIFGITMGIKLYLPIKEDVWLIGSMMAVLAIFVSTFINMLVAKGILYDAKDNDFLLSLPINDRYIILARLFNVFVNALIYTSVMWIPMIVHSLIFYGFSALNLLYGIITLILLSSVVAILACIFGHLISILTSKFKKKNLVTTILTLALLALYYFVYFNANRIMMALLAHKEEFIYFMSTKGILFSLIGKAVVGDSLMMLLSIVAYLAICLLGFLFILPRYRKQLISTPAYSKKEFKGDYSKQSSVSKTLINRELKLFFSNATYTLNCGLSIIILIGGAVALLIFINKIEALLPLLELIPFIKTIIPIVLLFLILLIVGMDALSVPAVSLEGKNYWLIRSLPIPTYDVLNSKRLLQFRLHIVPALIVGLVCAFIFKMDGLTEVLFILGIVLGVTFITYVDLFLGITGANLKWTDATTVIKGSGNVAIAIFGNMILFGGLGALYAFVLNKYIPTEAFLGIILAIFAIISFVLDRWLKVKGTKIFEDLG